uniref:Uncharacterized protein n=1 Tax=Meloidogyne enterolobii TaxID=390850 RepID=A0A6V7Y4M3_MELEN|nr:unnamed protein product [Meloidogyne enterolobii]
MESHIFCDEHKTEWVYREPKLTSLAEACDHMVESVRLALGHDRVQVLNDKSIDEANLDPSTAFHSSSLYRTFNFAQ